MSLLTTAAGSAVPRVRRLAGTTLDAARWFAVGGVAAVGLLVASDLPGRWISYGVLAIVLLCATPWLVRLAGSAERLTYVAFVMGLQAELEFAPISWNAVKVAGAYGIQISLMLIAAVALLGYWWLTDSGGETTRLRVHRTFLRASAVLLVGALLSFANSVDKHLSVFGTWEICALICVGTVASHYWSTRDGVETARAVLIASGIVQSMVILVEFLTGVQLSLSRGVSDVYAWGGGRYAGLFAAPSVAGAFLVVCLLFVLGRSLGSDARTASSRWGLVFAFGCLGLLLTQARSAWGALVIGSAGLVWHYYRRGRLRGRAVVDMAGWGLLALIVIWPIVDARLGQAHGDDAVTRWNLVGIAVGMVRSHPLLGIGINTATSQVRTFAGELGIGGTWLFIVHNQFLLVAAETGLIGLGAFVALFAFGLRAAGRCARAADPFISETGAVLRSALVAMVWSLNLDHVSGSMTYDLVWFLIGAAGGLSLLLERTTRTAGQTAGQKAGHGRSVPTVRWSAA